MIKSTHEKKRRRTHYKSALVYPLSSFFFLFEKYGTIFVFEFLFFSPYMAGNNTIQRHHKKKGKQQKQHLKKREKWQAVFSSTIQKRQKCKGKKRAFSFFFCVYLPFSLFSAPIIWGCSFFHFYSPMGVMGAPDDRAAPYMGEGWYPAADAIPPPIDDDAPLRWLAA